MKHSLSTIGIVSLFGLAACATGGGEHAAAMHEPAMHDTAMAGHAGAPRLTINADGDRYLEEEWLDVNGDGTYDEWRWDENDDGVWDGGKFDLNKDGRFDLIWNDLNGNGQKEVHECYDINPRQPVMPPKAKGN